MAASRMIVAVSSSADGRAALPDVPAGTAVLAGAAVVAGALVLGGAVVLAVGGMVPAGTDEVAGTPEVAVLGALDVVLPGVVELSCDWPGACAEAGTGTAAASAAQQIPAVRRRRRIRRHRLTKRLSVPSLIAARR
jgi:hypothetical protein